MSTRIEQWLLGIRTAEHHVKKRWVLGMSAISALLVVTLWLAYMHALLKPDTTVPTSAIATDASQGFWPIMKNGLRIVSHEIKTKIGNLIGTEEIITIEK